MQRISPIDPQTATGAAKDLMETARRDMGMVPNILRAMAHSPATLESYLGFKSAMAKSSLDAKTREAIALAVSEENGCRYCVSAHGAKGRTLGMSSEQVEDARRGRATERRTELALRFALELVRERGQASQETLDTLQAEGFGEAALAEIVALVALNTFSNYFNHVARTEIDFPVAAEIPQT
jgi:uncharacterized peroxidase-related enzyme